jgi:hypothetical protein
MGTGSKVQSGELAPPWKLDTIYFLIVNNLLNKST